MDHTASEVKAVSNPIQDQRKVSQPQSPSEAKQEPEVRQPVSYEL
jgi:hypothetical protein